MLLVLLALAVLAGGLLAWCNPRTAGRARDKAAALLPASLRRYARFTSARRASLAGADTLARVRVAPRGRGPGSSSHEMVECFVSSPLSMASFSGMGRGAPATPLRAPAADAAAPGGDPASPLSAFAIGGGALVPMDGSQAAYMPPTSVSSGTGRVAEPEPGDYGVRTLQRLE